MNSDAKLLEETKKPGDFCCIESNCNKNCSKKDGAQEGTCSDCKCGSNADESCCKKESTALKKKIIDEDCKCSGIGNCCKQDGTDTGCCGKDKSNLGKTSCQCSHDVTDCLEEDQSRMNTFKPEDQLCCKTE